jgi:hypothetical protein
MMGSFIRRTGIALGALLGLYLVVRAVAEATPAAAARRHTVHGG